MRWLLLFGIMLVGCHFDSLQLHWHKHMDGRTDTVTVDVDPDPDSELEPWETP